MADEASFDMDQSQSNEADTASEASDSAEAAPVRRMTQEKLNEIISERIAADRRARSTHVGISDKELKALKAKAAKFDEFQQEQMGELEKAKERAAQLERELAEANAAKQDSLLRAAVVAEAAKRNVVDPDAALALMDRSLLEFGDDGTPQNIADAMESLLTAKPYLVGGGNQPRGSADLGARGTAEKSQISREQLKSMSPAEIVEAQNSGALDHLLGKS